LVWSLDAWSLLSGSVLLGAFGQVFLKLAVQRVELVGVAFYLGLAREAWLYAGVASYGLSFATWLAALRSFEISFARPLTSMGYIVTYLVAVLVLGEELTARRLAGVGVITVGVLMMR